MPRSRRSEQTKWLSKQNDKAYLKRVASGKCSTDEIKADMLEQMRRAVGLIRRLSFDRLEEQEENLTSNFGLLYQSAYDVSRLDSSIPDPPRKTGEPFYDITEMLRWADEVLSGERNDKKGDKHKESLEIRVGRVVLRHPDMISSEVAALAQVTGKNPGGTVRATRAWKNRKQLRRPTRIQKGHRVLEDISGGFSDTGRRSDQVGIVSEPQAEHRDINEMIKEFQLGQRNKYPSPKEIAQLLSTPEFPVSEQRAAELLKETNAIYDYSE